MVNEQYTTRRLAAFFSCLAIGLALLTGCGPAGTSSPNRVSPATSEEAPTIRVLVVDDPDWVEALREQWEVRASSEQLEVRTATSEQLKTARRLSADVVVYPARWMGELVQRELILPMPENTSQPGLDQTLPSAITLDQLLPTVRQCDVSWGRTVYAATLGSPQFVLLYRPDVIKKLELPVPQTWAELTTAAEKLGSRESLGDLAPAADRPWHAVLEPTADGWASMSLLARAAASARSEGQLYTLFDVDDMSARIATPPMVQAATEMARTAKLSGVSSEKRLTPAEVRQAFFAGECAMAITWPSSADSAHRKPSQVPVAFAELPGSERVYSFQNQRWSNKGEGADRRASLCGVAGRMVSVTKEARRSRSAFQFVAWLQDDEVLKVLGPASAATTLFTHEQLSEPQLWTGATVSAEAAGQYASVAEPAFSRTAWTPALRIPGVDEYLAALDTAVVKALNDPDQAQPALSTAAEQWNEITKRYDLNRQRRAYQRSLGNDF